MAAELVTFDIPLGLIFLFLFFLVCIIAQKPSMFVKRHGRYHAMFGLFYLVWITYGFSDLFFSTAAKSNYIYFLYDGVLGLLGIVLTLLAAYEFQHKNVTNVASGTLDEHATVTYSEMIEHSFYQLLNLFQIIFLHAMIFLAEIIPSTSTTTATSTSNPSNFYGVLHSYSHILLLIFVTCLWNIRHLYPINRFSDNYVLLDEKSSDFIRFLYRIKKYQYVFYKHFLLHGLNLTIAYNYHGLRFPRSGLNNYADESLLGIVHSKDFHLYWLSLNLSYVMEFFLQTLVKKRYLSQERMLMMQQILMLAATLIAVNVLRYVNIPLALLSLTFNFIHRKHDFLNTIIIFLGWTAVITLSYPVNIAIH
eukprot:gene4747-5094_t